MKDRKTLLYFLILSTFLISMMALLASADTSMNNKAKSSALYNPDTNSFLYTNNADLKLPLASTTKIITALIAIENLDPNELITVTKEAVGIEGSSLYLSEGDVLSVKDLIYGVLLQSANDAATVIALRISGTVSAFAEKMTDRAKEIGATNTRFENPHGLDSKEHYTTARDLSLISAEAMKNETFKKIASTYKYTFKIGEKTRTVVNHNKMLKMYDGCIGVKTGYTKKSGRCLVSAAEKDGVTLIAVTLSDPNDWDDHKDMLDYGFGKLEKIILDDVVKFPKEIPTVSNDGATVKLRLSKNEIVKYKSDNLTYQIYLPNYVASDIKSNDKIGQIILRFGDNEEKIDIVAANDVKIIKNKRRFL